VGNDGKGRHEKPRGLNSFSVGKKRGKKGIDEKLSPWK